jgi:predicted nucleic acid-binding protein
MTTTNEPSYLLDSNIIVYSIDAAEAAKQARAIDVFTALAVSGRGVLSVQVLGEFFRASTRRIKVPLSDAEAEGWMGEFARAMPLLETTLGAILDGARGVRLHQLSFWDAVIWATAKRNGVSFLLSEDMGDGRLLEGVRILNPLSDSFDVSVLG